MNLTIIKPSIVMLMLACFSFSQAARATIVENDITTSDFPIDIDCDQDGTPEDSIIVSLSLHVLVTSTETKSGTVLTTHFQPVGASAVSETTGVTYHAVGITRDVTTTSNDDGTFTFVNNFYIIGTKSGSKMFLHTTAHGTTVNGEVVLDFDHSTATCR